MSIFVNMRPAVEFLLYFSIFPSRPRVNRSCFSKSFFCRYANALLPFASMHPLPHGRLNLMDVLIDVTWVHWWGQF